ncbi:hypothetical protein, partial [Pontibacter roseus]|uniref:hypothetical protein n=1 Tax=Pontibacter roseus TaxID=336989 RepID=UPI0012FAF7F8
MRILVPVIVKLEAIVFKVAEMRRLNMYYFISTAVLVIAFAAVTLDSDLEEINPGMGSAATQLATSASLLYQETFEGGDPFSTA